jgi:hypothetical protein
MVVELTVDEKDDTGVDIISFVEHPAIEVDFLYFNQNKEKYQFKDDEKRIVVGCAMIPNEKIVRLDADGNEYFVFFSEDTVRQCSELYFKRSKQNGTNIDHNDPVNSGVTVVESWIVEDPENDKSKALGFKDVLRGSWFVSYKVDNDTLWDKVKAGEVLGFSVEGLFTQTVTQENSKMENELFEIIESCMTREEKIDAIKEKIK